jgi:hypothetical protein
VPGAVAVDVAMTFCFRGAALFRENGDHNLGTVVVLRTVVAFD